MKTIIYKTLLYTLAFIAACFVPDPMFGVEIPDIEKELKIPIRIQADRTDYLQTEQLIMLTGNVLCRYMDLTLRADTVNIHVDTLDVEASGNVFLKTGYGMVVGEKLFINIPKNTMLIEKGYIELPKEGYLIKGDKLEKKPGLRFIVEEGEITSCLCAKPRPWVIKTKKMDINFHGTSKVRGAKIELLETPVVYFPFFILPIKKDRQTGFLMPRMAYSDRDGFKFGLPIYLDIKRNMDATFAIDYRGRRGIGGDFEYRYIFSEDSFGRINVTAFNETFSGLGRRERIDAKKGRFRIDMSHFMDFFGKAYLRADIHYTNDRTMVRDLSSDSDVRSLPYFKTKLAAAYNTQDAILLGELRYFQNLQFYDPFTVQQLPHLGLYTTKTNVLSTPFTFSLDSSSDYFFSKEGEKGIRVDIHPTLSYPTIPFDLFYFSPYVGFRGTLYDESNNIETRELYTIGFRSKTELLKDYNLTCFGFKKLRHILEPSLNFKHIPEENQSRIPYYMSNDDILHTDAITYSLQNRFYVKTANNTSRELFKYTISQTYDFQGNYREPYYMSNKTRHLSNLKNAFEVLPVENVFLDSSFEYNPDISKLSVFSAFLRYDTNQGSAFEVGYRYNTDDLYDINGIQALAEVRISSMLSFYIGNRYLIGERKNLESVYGVEYNSPCDCLDILFTYEQRVNPDEHEFAVLFNLKGLGFFGSKPFMTRLMDRELDYWQRFWGQERYDNPSKVQSSSLRHPLTRRKSYRVRR